MVIYCFFIHALSARITPTKIRHPLRFGRTHAMYRLQNLWWREPATPLRLHFTLSHNRDTWSATNDALHGSRPNIGDRLSCPDSAVTPVPGVTSIELLFVIDRSSSPLFKSIKPPVVIPVSLTLETFPPAPSG